MQNTVILIIAIFLILVVIGGIMLSTIDNKHKGQLALGSPYDRVLCRKGVMKLLKDKNVKLNSPDNILLPDALPALKPEILAKVSVKTLEDTSSILMSVISAMNLDLDHLKAMSPDQIVALNPFQLAIIDAQYGGADNSFTALAPLVTPEQLKAVIAVFQKQDM